MVLQKVYSWLFFIEMIFTNQVSYKNTITNTPRDSLLSVTLGQGGVKDWISHTLS